MNKRFRVFFSGSVQGVGFRYTALVFLVPLARRILARGIYPVAQSDGRVEILAEGSEKVLKSFVQEVEERMSGCSDNKLMEWEIATGEWESFGIAPTE